MSTNFDLEVNNYSIDEIYTILNVEKTKDIPQIKQRVNALIDEIKNGEIDYNYVVFLKNIEQRLIDLRHEEDTKEQIKIYTDKILNEKISSIEETYINKYPKGDINPIKRNIVTQVINIDSLFRTNYDATDADNFIYTLINPINKVVSMRLSSLEIPNIWYGFSKFRNNNKFFVRLFNVPQIAMSDTTSNEKYSITSTTEFNRVSVEHTIVIPDGNYSSTELEDILNNYFINIGNGLQYLKFEIDNYTGKSSFYLRRICDIKEMSAMEEHSTSELCYELDFAKEQNINNIMEENCGWTLGFRKSDYIINGSDLTPDYFVKKELSARYGLITSEGAYGTSLNNYFFICVNDYNNNYKNSIISDKNSSYLGDSILGRIAISSPSNTILNDNGSDRIFKTREYFGPVKIDKLKISLIDKYGKRLMLNKNDFSMTLEMEQIY